MAVTVTGTPVLYSLPSTAEASSTLSVTVPAGATTLVVAAGNLRGLPSRTISSIVFNGSENLTQRITQTDAADFVRTDIWSLDNPTVTTANVVVTWSGVARGAVTALCLTNAASGAPAATNSAQNSNALSVATVTDGIVISSYIVENGDATTIALTAGTSIANQIGSAGAAANSSRQGVATQAGTGGSVSTTWTPTGTGTAAAHVVAAFSPSGGTAALTGTLTTRPAWNAEIQAGGLTLIATLTGDTFVAAGSTFDATRQAIIDGLTAGTSTSNGWNEVVKATCPVTAVVRTSGTVCTITLPAFATYNPSAGQTITVTLPASCLTLAAPIVATPTFTTKRGPVLSVTSGNTNGSGVLTFTVSNDDPDAANGEFTKLTATSGSAVSRSSARFT